MTRITTEPTVSAAGILLGDEVLVACGNARDGCQNMVRVRFEHTPSAGALGWPICQDCRERQCYEEAPGIIREALTETDG